MNPPAKSPVRSCSNSAENQCSDTPFIGKVKPAGRPLERQDEDRRHRAVQERDEQREERRQRSRSSAAACRDLFACGSALV